MQLVLSELRPKGGIHAALGKEDGHSLDQLLANTLTY